MVTLLITILLISDTLTLYPEDAVRMALRQNFDLREARYQLQSSEIQKIRALFSLIPYGTISGNYSKYRQDGKIYEKRGYSLNIEQLLFDPDRLLSYLVAKNNLSMQKLSYSSLKSDVTLNVLQLYYRVLTVQKKVDYLKQAVTLAKKEFDAIRVRKDLGTATDLDLLRAKINYLQSENSLNQAEIELEKVKRELKLLLGVPQETVLVIAVSSIPYENFDVRLTEDLRDSVVKAQEEYRKLLISAEEAKWNYRKAILSFLPKVYLGYQSTHDRLDPGFSTNNSIAGFYVNFSLNLNSYPFNIKLQKKNIQLQRLYVKRVTYSILKALDDAYDRWKAARLDLELAAENKKLASLLYSKSKEKYRAGAITSLEYFDTQVRLKEANLRLIEARYNYYVALINLKTLLGMEVLR